MVKLLATPLNSTMSRKGCRMTVNEETVKVTIIELEKLWIKTLETSVNLSRVSANNLGRSWKVDSKFKTLIGQ